MKNFLAVIPARKGSTELKNKNFLKFNQKPLIYWTIKEALKSKYIDDIIVSSDSGKILNYCKKFKKITASFRPKKYAKKNTNMLDLLKYIKKVQFKNINYRYLIILQPTSPLRTFKDIDASCKIIIKNKFDSLVSIEEISHKYFPKNIYKKKKDELINLKNKNILKNRQNYRLINKFYARNGAAIYITKYKFISKFILGGKIGGYIMPKWKNLDINDYFDFKLAEYVMKNKKLHK